MSLDHILDARNAAITTCGYGSRISAWVRSTRAEPVDAVLLATEVLNLIECLKIPLEVQPVLARGRASMRRISRGHFAVFTRNHQVHRDEAVALCANDSERPVTFRSATLWASAERAVSPATPLPMYVAVVGGPATVQYVADLWDVQTRPHLRRSEDRSAPDARHGLDER